MRNPHFLPAAAAAFAALVVGISTSAALARPNYLPEFKATYPEVKDVDTVKCGVCHIGKPTAKTWNDYGTAFGKSLGIKKANKQQTQAALKKVEGEPSAVEGKTFGDLMKEGKLPGKPEGN